MTGLTRPQGHVALERRMRHRRVAKIVIAIMFAIVWFPIAVIMIVASATDRRA